MGIAVVTGVSSGIGNKIANELLNCGYEVYGIDINECYIKGLCFFRIDISDEKSVFEVIKEIVAETQFIDYMINAAGIISVNKCFKFSEVPLIEWERVMAVNLRGAFLMSKACIPYMREGGCIIHFSSEQVESPNLKSAPYAISKAGIEMMNKIIALECLDYKVRSNVIALGSVDTKFIAHMVSGEKALREKMENANLRMPFGIISVEDVWETTRYILFDAKKMTGQKVIVDSGMILG